MAMTQAPKGDKTSDTSRDVPVDQGEDPQAKLAQNRAEYGGHPKPGEYNTKDGQPFGDPLPREQALAGQPAPEVSRRPNADNVPDPEAREPYQNQPELPPKLDDGKDKK